MNHVFTPTPATAVRDIAVAMPGATHVFDELHIDYCCSGLRDLAGAAALAHVTVDEVLARLAAEARRAGTAREPMLDASLGKLIDHIVETHHTFTRVSFARALPLADKVYARHGQEHPELELVRELTYALRDELEPHLAREELVLFPALRRLEHAQPAAAFLGHLSAPLTVLSAEHDRTRDLLAALREASSGFTAPEDACGSLRAFYAVLADLELDLVHHVHLENNVLFPRALAYADAARDRTPRASPDELAR